MSKVIDTSSPPTENIILADEWHSMNINELYEQKIILQNRIFASSEIKNRSLLLQLQKGMVELEAIIQQKSKGETIVI